MIKKILVDECLPAAMADAINAFVAMSDRDLVAKHVKRDLGLGGSDDDVWMNELKPAGEWLVITCDMARSNDGAPLPRIAELAGVKVLWLYRKLSARSSIERARAIFCMWPDIEEHVLRDRTSKRWRIKCLAARGFTLEPWESSVHKQRELVFPKVHAPDKPGSRG